MPLAAEQLDLSRCPHCKIDRPTLQRRFGPFNTEDYLNSASSRREWSFYVCVRCGGGLTVATRQGNVAVSEIYPSAVQFDEAIPERPRNYLQQASDTLHSPSASIVMSASAVDAMLKVKGYRDGNLYGRIDTAAKDHLITDDMATWAHQVRLDANEQRHADEDLPLPTNDDAQRSLTFAQALAQFLFVLPAMVAKGLEETKPS